MSFISSSYDEVETVIPTVSDTEHRLVQDLYDKVKGEKMNNDLISRSALKAYARTVLSGDNITNTSILKMFDEIIDNAPTDEDMQKSDDEEIIATIYDHYMSCDGQIHNDTANEIIKLIKENASLKKENASLKKALQDYD